jgi:hypothetical protein
VLPPEIEAALKLRGKKHRQHYVFRRYLKRWATKDRLAVLRKGEIRESNLTRVAVEKQFYKLQPITPDDVTLIRTTLLESANDFVRSNAESLIKCFTLPFVVRDLIEANPPVNPLLSAWVEEQIVNGEENLHCGVEEGLMGALDEMLDGKTDFFLDPRASYEFLYAISVQYLRTKRMREAIGAVRSPFAGSDMTRIRGLYTLISAMRIADSMYEERARHKLVLLDNQTGIPFITGDQPIINLHATFGDGAPESLEFYYPISPTRAMVLVNAATSVEAIVRGDRVSTLNGLMVRNSHDQVFSNSAAYLESFRGQSLPTGTC